MLQEIDDGAGQDLWDELNQEAQTTDDLAIDSHGEITAVSEANDTNSS